MRFASGDVRDHIVSSKIDQGPPWGPLKSDTAAEKSKNQPSRDFSGSFDFRLLHNSIGGGTDIRQLSRNVRNPGLPCRDVVCFDLDLAWS